MPNHIQSQLQIECTEEYFNKIIKETTREVEGMQQLDIDMFFPMPKALEGTTSPTRIVSAKEKQEAIDKKNAMADDEPMKAYTSIPLTQEEADDLVKNYGHSNWYDWKVKNWGTKWGTYSGSISEDKQLIFFQSAWSFPFGAIEKLSELYPEAKFHAAYSDEDLGSNIGFLTYVNGELVNGEEVDEFYDNISDRDSSEDLRYAFATYVWGYQDDIEHFLVNYDEEDEPELYKEDMELVDKVIYQLENSKYIKRLKEIFV
jgi:hypothetical protein